MLKKIRLLIIVAILGLLALSLVQGYLINNTYKLKKNAFISDTRKSISRLDDLSPNLDTINDIWQERFLEIIVDYKLKKINKEKVLSLFKGTTEPLNGLYIDSYQNELKEKKIGYDLKFQKIVKRVIVLDSISTDTIFLTKNDDVFHLIGDQFTLNDGHKVSSSLWLTEHSSDKDVDGEPVKVSFNLQFETEDRMNIDGWEKIVLGRMSGLLLLSFLVFLVVFGLLYYSIKSLITQKKIADIKTDFVNNITHELKTPLSTLTLATKMLKIDKNVSNSNITKATINTIERQNIRLQKLIDQVLTNSLGYQEIKLQKELIKVDDYLNTTLNDFQLSFSNKNITLNRKLEITKSLYIDKFYFTTAILNILENAVKYGKDKVEIVVASSFDNGNLIISITDNGIGIPQKEIPFLFDKFYRVGNTEIHNVKGLGLGLYYTNQIIKAHKGKIEVNSKKNIGTTFSILIPIV